jgi:hypothetical protein
MLAPSPAKQRRYYVPRKSEQQITLEEQHRLWMGKLRKARTLQQQTTIAKVLKDIEARLWPSAVDEAKASAAATKLELKLQKKAAARAKETEAAELERLKEIERQKVHDEENPVLDHVKRAVIRQKLHQEHVQSLAAPVEADEVMVDLPVTTVDEAPVTAPVEVTEVPPVMVISPELVTITREAEASAKRQSSTRRDDEEFFERVMKPLESRDVIAPSRRYAADSESSGPGETFARLGGYNNALEQHEPVDEGGYLSEWNWAPQKW